MHCKQWVRQRNKVLLGCPQTGAVAVFGANNVTNKIVID